MEAKRDEVTYPVSHSKAVAKVGLKSKSPVNSMTDSLVITIHL